MADHVLAARRRYSRCSASTLRRERGRIAIVDDHVVRKCETCVSLCLRRERGQRLLTRHAVALHQARDLQLLGSVHDQHAVDVVAAAAFGEQRYHEHLVRPRGSRPTAAPSRRGSRDAGCPRAASGRGVAEDALAHSAAVHAAVRAEDPGTERRDDLGEGRLTRLDDLPGDHVGVDQRHAVTRKQVRDGRLAAGDAAGKRDAERGRPGILAIVGRGGCELPPF